MAFDLPAQLLAVALDSLAKTAHTKLVYAEAAVKGLRADAVTGDFTVQQALERMLAHSGTRRSAMAFLQSKETGLPSRFDLCQLAGEASKRSMSARIAAGEIGEP